MKALVKRGALVGLLDINEEAGQALEKELGGDQVCFSVCDVRKEESIQAAIVKTEKKWSKAKTGGCIK